jgi:Cu/Ag efflux protein CusF
MRIPIILALSAVLTGCENVQTPSAPVTPAAESTVGQADPTGPLKEFSLTGEIVSIDPTAKAAVIKHQNIEGLMPAMTMTFPVPEDAELQKIKPGDMITATVYQRPSDARYWVGNIQLQTP